MQLLKGMPLRLSLGGALLQACLCIRQLALHIYNTKQRAETG